MNKRISKMQNKIISKFIICVWVFLISSAAFPKHLLANDFIQTYIIRHGGSDITAEEAAILAKYDMFNCNRFHYNDVSSDTWSAIKAINPNVKIFLYQDSCVRALDDEKNIMFLNNVGRWNISRGHSMGNLNTNNPELFLLDSKLNRIYVVEWPDSHVMDVGSNNWINYWLEATVHDLVDQPYTADGVFIDVVPFSRSRMTAMPVKYKSDDQYAEAQHKFINKVAVGLGEKNQKVICNTRMKEQSDFDNYVTLDNSYAPPYALFNEGSFAVQWGPADVQFYPESHWKLEVDLMSQIHNFKILSISHANLRKGQSGTDNWGNSVTFWDIFWYAMGSYHLGKNTVDNNSYWGFSESYNKATWYDEFDYIDLGPALGKYKVTNYNGNNIYWREFEKGYVYVNPTKYSVSAISLPIKCKQLTRDNFKKDPDTLASINTINLKGNRAAFLLKETYDNNNSVPAAPTNLKVNP
jgi:hypothetical protein